MAACSRTVRCDAAGATMLASHPECASMAVTFTTAPWVTNSKKMSAGRDAKAASGYAARRMLCAVHTLSTAATRASIIASV